MNKQNLLSNLETTLNNGERPKKFIKKALNIAKMLLDLIYFYDKIPKDKIKIYTNGNVLTITCIWGTLNVIRFQMGFNENVRYWADGYLSGCKSLCNYTITGNNLDNLLDNFKSNFNRRMVYL